MGRKHVTFQKSVLAYLDNIREIRQDSFIPGLIFGQRLKEDEDFVIFAARTKLPPNEDGSTRSVKSIVELNQDWIEYHMKNVIKMVPGGMRVLGLFFAGHVELNEAESSALNSLLQKLRSYEWNGDDFKDMNVILFFQNTDSYECKFHKKDGTFVEMTTISQPVKENLVNLRCYYSMKKTFFFQSGSLQENSETIVEDVEKTLNKVLFAFDGAIVSENALVKDVKPANEGESNAESNQAPIVVDLYSPLLKILSPSSSGVLSVTLSSSSMICSGTLCGNVYIYENAKVAFAAKALKEDLLRSLRSRLLMHWNSCMEDLSVTDEKDGKIIHEPPRRMAIPLPGSNVSFTDYLFPGESELGTVSEFLDIDESEMLKRAPQGYEALEAVFNKGAAGPFHNEQGGLLFRIEWIAYGVRLLVFINTLFYVGSLWYNHFFQEDDNKNPGDDGV